MNENKPKYVVVNDDSIIAMIYMSEKYGRTMVINGGLNWNYPVQLLENVDDDWKKIEEKDFISFICEMLPKEEVPIKKVI